MTRKQTLLGYAGMPETFQLAGGTELNAGEALAIARDWNASLLDLHTDAADSAWNDLTDDQRWQSVQASIDRINATITSNATGIDNATDATALLHDRAGLTLWGDLIDAALTEVKAIDKPWEMMTADAQSEVLERITKRVKAAGLNVIRDLATRGNASIVCELESITVKKGAKATLEVPKSALTEALLDAVGGAVYLVIATGADEVSGIKAPPASPDQADLLASTLPGGDDGMAQHSDPRD